MLTFCKKYSFITTSDRVVEMNYQVVCVISRNFLLIRLIFTEKSLCFGSIYRENAQIQAEQSAAGMS